MRSRDGVGVNSKSMAPSATNKLVSIATALLHRELGDYSLGQIAFSSPPKYQKEEKAV